MVFNRTPGIGSLFELEFPQSVAVFDRYPQAQKAVDHLADHSFPVRNLAIVGTELRSVERVLGRRTWWAVVAQGIVSGIGTGVLVGLLMMLFGDPGGLLVIMATAVGIGAVIGVIFTVVTHAMTRGRRDFNSVSQIVATRYELLSEHKVAQQARELIAQMPGERARMFE